MEEKLYFEPEPSGKNRKKEKLKKEKKDGKLLKLFCFLFLLVVIIMILIWLMRGSKTVSGQYPENVKNESLSCEIDGLKYPKLENIDSEKKNLKINLIFNEKEELNTISLIYTLYLDGDEAVRYAEAKGHADFNLGLNEIGLNSAEFDNKFAHYSDRLIVSLFGKKSDINEYKASYFMINDIHSTSDIPETIEEYTEIYEGQGFTCKSTKE